MKSGAFPWEKTDYDTCFRCGAKLTKQTRRVISLIKPSDGTVLASAGVCDECEEAVKEAAFRSSEGGKF